MNPTPTEPPGGCPSCGEGQVRLDHSQCAGELRKAFADIGIDATVSTAPPLVRNMFTVPPYVCPHGVEHWAEPTGEQIGRWNAEKAP